MLPLERPYFLSKEPYIHSKESYIHSKDPYNLSKETHIPYKKPYILFGDAQQQVRDQLYDQRENSATFVGC